MLHEQLLRQQLSAQQSGTTQESNFNILPPHIISTLDNMAYGIAQKEGFDSFETKQKMVNNINKLYKQDLNYLVEQLSILIDKSVNQNETIDDKNVDQNFISFLIRLYY